MDAILDSFLQYIATYLPPPLYSAVIALLSRLFATATIIIRLWSSLLSKTDWNIQAFLPAIISILAAYFALSSLYRTTSWVIRTSFWFIKWSTIISILLAGASYYMGNDVAVGNQGIIPNIGRYVVNLANMANGDQGSEHWQRVKSRQGKKQKLQRPKAWESFERHSEWQYQEANDRQIEEEPLTSIVANAVDYVLEKSEWWALAKNMWGSGEEGSEGSSKNANSRKSPSGSSRSR